ncbi:MAG: DNA primase [Bacillota bacterium]
MALIPRDTIEDVRIQTDIVSLVSQYVRLEKRGRNYTGLCPFHQDKDPSFTVNPEKQMFYCFGCQAGGNSIKFAMMIENLSFTEAVKRLAGQAGIVIPDYAGGRDDGRAAREERAWSANAAAAEFYHRCLLEGSGGSRAREYLAGRGLSPEIIEAFKIGYAPDSWDALIKHMRENGYSTGELFDYGLVSGDRNRAFDRFRNRIIFPVRNSQGRIVAFGGRVLGKAVDQPKYLNTPETLYFNKSKILYGLDQARQAIRQAGYAVMMEGYMDVVTAHQFGIRNALASMGTSLTAEQGKLLIRYTRDVYIAYDSDAAGVKAASRGLDILQQIGCRLKVISMPEGTDPDEFIRKYGARGWQEIISGPETRTLLEYKLGLAGSSKKDASDILEEVLPNLAAIRSDIEIEEAVKTVASRLNLSWEAVRGEIRRYKASQRKIGGKPDKIAKKTHNIIKSPKPRDAISKAELGILKIIVHMPEKLGSFREALGDDFIQENTCRELYRAVTREIDAGTFDPARLLNELEEPAASLLSRLTLESPDWREEADKERVINDYIGVIKRNYRDKERMILLQELSEAEKNKDIRLVNDILKSLQEMESGNYSRPGGKGEEK